MRHEKEAYYAIPILGVRTFRNISIKEATEEREREKDSRQIGFHQARTVAPSLLRRKKRIYPRQDTLKLYRRYRKIKH
jgi:hypothetical protein